MGLETDVITDLAVLLTIASIVALIFYKLKQPIVIGYLITGILIGPYTPPFALIKNIDILNVFAELGVILLLFSIGLEFPIKKFRSIGRAAIVIAAFEITLTMMASWFIGITFGWQVFDTIFLGVALASSSTTIIVKVLSDIGRLGEISSKIMIGILIIEDISVVFMLAMLQSIATIGVISSYTLLFLILKIGVFIGGTLGIGFFIIPRLIDRIVKVRHGELLHHALLGLCFGFAIIANQLGLFVAIGAFIIGVVIAESKSAEEENRHFGVLKDMFGAIFFVSIGALMDISQLLVFWFPALIITLTLMITKTFSCGIGTRLFGYDNKTSMKVGLGMAQIGEFAFIATKAGDSLGVISPFLTPIIGVSAIITSFTTPYFIKTLYKDDLWIFRLRKKFSWRSNPKK